MWAHWTAPFLVLLFALLTSSQMLKLHVVVPVESECNIYLAIKVAFIYWSTTWKFREAELEKLERNKLAFGLGMYAHFSQSDFSFLQWGHNKVSRPFFNSCNAETELQRDGTSTGFLNLLLKRRNSINHQLQQCKNYITLQTYVIVHKFIFNNFCHSPSTETMNSQPKTASQAITLETKCCKRWAGRKTKVWGATNRTSRLPSRWGGPLQFFYMVLVSLRALGRWNIQVNVFFSLSK